MNLIDGLLTKLTPLAIATAIGLLSLQSSALGQIVFNGNVTNGTSNVNTTYNGTDNPWDHGSSNLIVGHEAEGNLFIFGAFEVLNAQTTIAQNSGVIASATVNGPGAKWANTVNGTFTIGALGEGELNIDNGGQVTNFRGVIANNGSSEGSVTVSNGSQWNNSEDLRMATSNNTTATMLIQSGSTVTNRAGTIGGWSSADASVTVTGGSTWTNSTTLTVAAVGMGTLDINDGGIVSATDSIIGQISSGTGIATVSGTGSRWTNSSNMTVGFLGNANLNISNDGLVTSSRSILAERVGSFGTATLTSGGMWNNSSDFFVGGSSTAAGGTGTLNIQSQGSVTVGTTMKVWDNGTINLNSGSLDVFRLDLTSPNATGNFNMTDGLLTVNDEILGDFQQDGGTLAFSGFSPTEISMNYIMNGGDINFDIGGTFRGFQYDALDVLGAGGAFLDGTMDVNLTGLAPMLGQEFLLIDAMTYSSGANFDFDFDDASLSSFGLEWDTSTFLTDGTIRIVNATIPEPGSMAVILVTSMCLFARRTRRPCA